MADPATDPLAWWPVKAPSLAEFEVLADDVYRRLPKGFRDLCANVVIQIDDFPTRDVLRRMQIRSRSICSVCSMASACRSAAKARRCRCPT